MIRFTKIFRFCFLLIPLLFECGINTAGGGVIVNNPCVMGRVSFAEGHGAFGAMVVMGLAGKGGVIDTVVDVKHGDFNIIYNLKMLDTTYTDVQGRFTFENHSPGNYVVVAIKKEVKMLALENVTCSFNDTFEINLELKPAAKITIKPYYFIEGDSGNFLSAQIAGTGIVANANDSTGVIEFDMVPQGDLDLVLLRSDKSMEFFPKLKTESDSNSILRVYNNRPSSYWTAIVPGARDPKSRPYILGSSPLNGATGDQINQAEDRTFDIEIRFSHPMDGILTENALAILSSDGSTSLDSAWWRGGNILCLNLCTKNSLGECAPRDSLYKKGVTYSVIIDTIAESSYGVRLAYPDTLTFVPKP